MSNLPRLYSSAIRAADGADNNPVDPDELEVQAIEQDTWKKWFAQPITQEFLAKLASVLEAHEEAAKLHMLDHQRVIRSLSSAQQLQKVIRYARSSKYPD